MHITIVGAKGAVGQRVVAEAWSRGHEVTAVMRDLARMRQLPAGVRVRAGDAGNVEDVAALSAGQDVVISATRPAAGSEGELVTTGNSSISMEDLAVALLDEAERPARHRVRFTVAY